MNRSWGLEFRTCCWVIRQASEKMDGWIPGPNEGLLGMMRGVGDFGGLTRCGGGSGVLLSCSVRCGLE